MKKITSIIAYSVSIVLILIGIYLEISNTFLTGGSVAASKFNRQGEDLNLSGISVIIIGIIIILLTYSSFKEKK